MGGLNRAKNFSPCDVTHHRHDIQNSKALETLLAFAEIIAQANYHKLKHNYQNVILILMKFQAKDGKVYSFRLRSKAKLHSRFEKCESKKCLAAKKTLRIYIFAALKFNVCCLT